jgi:hypothetical protein
MLHISFSNAGCLHSHEGCTLIWQPRPAPLSNCLWMRLLLEPHRPAAYTAAY